MGSPTFSHKEITPLPTSSTSSSSSVSLKKPLKPDEANKRLDEEHIIKLTEEAFRKLTDYTRAELQVTVEDCQLLQTMNKTTKDKYSQMSLMSQRLMKEMSKVQNTYADFDSFIKQIDDIHQQAQEMEEIAKSLDQYSKYLEDKVIKTQNQRQSQH
ncbi:biogenesis of lysosome-related organelles complex-1 subunit 2-domain-containing protein [Halteromyces radiatus]|uniref:biogenesis of lysosome-related organelles complex-1 subunit 2-domain-containing protein n=1 Tax=Halteromyces radiatus TaxID=101107 RepID=UPI0022206761|nr:biogenesis of lysosome-related organelles complex-1 subunit 2-domain-containing protein [Halteromyces radiatus]KAI8089658.1 biogenesis of lysosome-related organelles complex-1 subunit 2-domain-containing protein [Halteromyces radiatus]